MIRKIKPCKCGCGNSGYIWAKGMLKGCYVKIKPPKQIRKTKIKPKPRKKTGQYDVFMEISASRPHICYVTGTPVNVWESPGKLNVWCFMHVISKGADIRMMLWADNIQIAHPWVHRIYDQGGPTERAEMAEKYPGWNKLLAFKDELKERFLTLDK